MLPGSVVTAILAWGISAVDLDSWAFSDQDVNRLNWLFLYKTLHVNYISTYRVQEQNIYH